MDKNTVWAIGLSTVVIVGSLFIQTKFFPPQQQVQNLETTEENVSSSEEISSSQNVHVSTINSANSVMPEKAEEFVIETNKARITFTNVGGDIIGYELLGEKEKDIDRPFNNNGKEDYRGVEMADSISEKNRAFALSFGGYSAPIINELFAAKKIDDYTIGFYRTFSTTDDNGNAREFTLAKTYSFLPDEYMFKLEVNVYGADGKEANLNVDGIGYTLRTSPQIGPHFDPKQNRYEYRRFMAYTNGKRKDTSLGNNQNREFEKSFSWTGIAGKYFEILAIPSSLDTVASLHYSTLVDSGYANSQILLSRKSVSANTTDTYYIYAGPRDEKNLVKYNASENNGWKLSGLRLNDSSASSWLAWIEIILKKVLELINKVVKNWGISIIIMTIIIKAAMFPLSWKSSVSMLKMQELQPKMQAIQKKYEGGDQQKMQAEVAKLYQEAGANPLSGCGPQIPHMLVILALYQLFNNYFEFRGAAFIPGWISDLSLGDSVLQLKNPLPFLNWNHIRILPFVYVIVQLVYGLISQRTSQGGASTQQQQQMKMMMFGMPVLFFFMFYNAPSGLLIYWTISNIIQLVQQIFINRMMEKKKAEMKLAKPTSKKR